jgi:uncharacterized membrane protein YuzA (DUF378 family)
METVTSSTTQSGSKAMSTIGWIAFALLVIGGLNWGLVGFFGFDLVAAIFGDMTAASRIVYGLVGLSAIYSAFALPAMKKRY